MNTEFIIGTIITIFFGILSYFQSRKRSTARLFFIVDEISQLQSEIAKKIEEIDSKYGVEVVKENLYLVKAYIFYYGDHDIQKEHVAKMLYIKLSNNSKWRYSDMIDKTEGLEVTSQIDKSKIEFGFDLLKSGDFFYFKSLCEISGGKPDTNKLFSVNHRIANIGKIKTLNYESDILPSYAPIVAWIASFSIAYFLIIPTIKIQNYNENDFKKEYYLGNKIFNVDSNKAAIRFNIKNKIDIVKRAIAKNNIKAEALKSKMSKTTITKLEELYKLDNIYYEQRRVNQLILKQEYRKIDLEGELSAVSYDRKYDVPKSDSAFLEFSRNYTFLYFLNNKSTLPLKINKSYSVSYKLIDYTYKYLSLGAIFVIAMLCFLSYLVTQNYFKYKAILNEINRVRRNTKSIQT